MLNFHKLIWHKKEHMAIICPVTEKILKKKIKVVVTPKWFDIIKIRIIINEIYDSGEITEDLTRTIFLALLKKPGAHAQ